LAQAFLSDIELYYSGKVLNHQILIDGEEYNHLIKVMRHRLNDIIHVTDGKGTIYISRISDISKISLTAEIISQIEYLNNLANITFCVPLLKSNDRFEYALEKSVELGITDFIIYSSNFSIKKNPKPERIEKIVVAAMKQSLRAWKPKVNFSESLISLKSSDSTLVMLDRNAEKKFSKTNFEKNDKYRIIFGPEGGFSPKEYSLLNDSVKLKLTDNRLRSETAIITTAILLNF